MFNFFKIGKNYFVGLDFGTSAIKVVELSYKNKKIYLENYGWVETGFTADGSRNANIVQSSFDQKLKVYLRELVQRLKLHSDVAYVSIPGYNGLINLVEFPQMKREDLEKAVQFEAKKHIPVPLDEISLSWEIVSQPGKDEKNQKIQVMLVAAPNKEVVRYESLIQASGLKTGFVELETFSLIRSLVGDDPSTFVVVDIGARTTNIILVEGGVIKANRNIDSGGYDVTTAISDSLKVSRNRADSLKKEKDDLLGGNDLALVVPSLEMINNEVKRMIQAYQERSRGKRVDGLILSGGSSKIKGLDRYLEKTVGVNAILGNPWKRIVVNPLVEPIIRTELGASFSVAIGLALSGVEAYQRS